MSNYSEQIFAVQIFDKEKVGLHARPVAKIVSVTNNQKYKETSIEVFKLNDDINLNEEIKLTGSEPKANGKSILSFIGLAVKHENKIAFVVKGEHSKEIIEEIKKVLKEEGMTQ